MSKSEGPAALSLVRKLFPLKTDSQSLTFDSIRLAVADGPLNEILPASPGDHAAALGFALGWAMMAAGDGMLFWAAPEADFFEDGLPNAEGLVQFGMDMNRLLMVRAASQTDALWAAEQALSTPHITALCAISASCKPLNLTATRRLLLTAERHKTRCILLRLDNAGASAAWSRWRVSTGSSQGKGRELGAPAFAAHLSRSRAGAGNVSFNLQWDIHSHAFRSLEFRRDAAMDGAVAAAPAVGPADADERSAA
jgi:protein ImuA